MYVCEHVRVPTQDGLNMLPSVFDLKDVEGFLAKRDTADNVGKCMKKIRRLVSGQGVGHKARSDVFMRGIPVLPSHDLEALRMRANEWLPYTRAKGRVDRTGGWTLNHPIAKLQLYKEEVLLSRSTAPPPVAVAVPVVAPPLPPPVVLPDVSTDDHTAYSCTGTPGYIYCFNTISNHNVYKVGMTEQFMYDNRLDTYDGGNKPYVIVGTIFVPDARDAERQLLAKLKTSDVLKHDKGMGKEWFRATDETDTVRRHLVISDIMLEVCCRSLHRKRPRDTC